MAPLERREVEPDPLDGVSSEIREALYSNRGLDHSPRPSAPLLNGPTKLPLPYSFREHQRLFGYLPDSESIALGFIELPDWQQREAWATLRAEREAAHSRELAVAA